ncbi:MAG: hypothetical protein HC837_05130 [Chloroflexaceae bacterium]|nr:hypothetical protein [Chloroflexaceae bacterium]
MTSPPDYLLVLRQRITTLEQMLTEREQLMQQQQTDVRTLTNELEHAYTTIRQLQTNVDLVVQRKADFLANLSHEIRTPLNAVIGMAELLLDTDLSPKQRDLAEMIYTGGTTSINLINDIRDLALIETGQFELTHQPYRLAGCVESSLDIVAPRAAAKHLDLIYYIDEDTPQIFVGDARRFEQVLINLLSSLIQLTENGEIALFVSATPCPPPDATARGEDGATEVASTWFRIVITLDYRGRAIPPDLLADFCSHWVIMKTLYPRSEVYLVLLWLLASIW